MPRWRNGRPACRQAGANDPDMFYVYALLSQLRKYIYVGITDNVNRRFLQHQRGYVKTTAPYRPFDMLYIEERPTRIEARIREKYLKSGTGKEFLKRIK
jgi:putative endonuclease